MKRGKNLAQRLTLPQEVVSQGPLAELHGNTSVCIENHGGILEYTDTRVCIAVQRGTLTVSGCGLRILRMTQRRYDLAAATLQQLGLWTEEPKKFLQPAEAGRSAA